MEAFITESVVPDALEAPPQEVMKLNFAGVDVGPGDFITAAQTGAAPTISWPAEEGALYTVIVTGLDAPSRMNRSQSEICLWLVVNVPGNDISKGKTVAAYFPPLPLKDTGKHRFLAVAFKQPGPIESDKIDNDIDPNVFDPKARNKRSASKMSAHWQLGAPCAGSFFITEYDSSVDARREAIGVTW